MAQPTPSAEDRFLAPLARSYGPPLNGSKGSIAVADDLSKVPEIRAKGASSWNRLTAIITASTSVAWPCIGLSPRRCGPLPPCWTRRGRTCAVGRKRTEALRPLWPNGRRFWHPPPARWSRFWPNDPSGRPVFANPARSRASCRRRSAEPYMNRTQLEHIIRAASRISDDSEIVVIGSQSIHAQEMRLPPIACISFLAVIPAPIGRSVERPSFDGYRATFPGKG